MDDFAALFAEDANFVIWWKNRTEIAGAHRATHETMFLDSHSRVLSHRLSNWLLALHRCNYTWTLTGASAPDGAPAGTRQGILLLVVKEEQSGWQTKLAQNTDVVPGALAPLLTKKGESLAHVTTSASRARSLCA